MMGVSYLAAVSDENFIIGTGPTQKTWSTSPACSRRSSGAVTTPCSPYEPSSVVMCRCSSSQIVRNWSSSSSRSLVRAPMMACTSLPAATNWRATGNAMARPTPPPMTAHLPGAISVGVPSGPVTSSRLSPSCSCESCVVVLPMTMKMNSTQPSSAFQSAKVKGTRSPVSLARTMRNWPAWACLAMRGASMRNLNTFSEYWVFLRILYMKRGSSLLQGSAPHEGTPSCA